MLKAKMHVISPSIVLFHKKKKKKPRNEVECYSYRLLFTSLQKIRVFCQGKYPMGLGSGQTHMGDPCP